MKPLYSEVHIANNSLTNYTYLSYSKLAPRMLIPNKFIKLEYDPAKDVLHFQWPDFHEYAVPELKYVLKSITDTIKSYDIKYLIIDARKSVISMSDPLYVEVTTQFSIDLKSTRLKKSARIIDDVMTRESQVQEIREKAGLTLDVKSFRHHEEALEWFKASESMPVNYLK